MIIWVKRTVHFVVITEVTQNVIENVYAGFTINDQRSENHNVGGTW